MPIMTIELQYALFFVIAILFCGFLTIYFIRKDYNLKLKNLSQNLSSIKVKLLEKQNIISDLNQNNRNLELEINSLQKETQYLNLQKQELRDNIKNLNNKILNIENQYNDKNLVISELQIENKNLKEKLDAEKKEIEHLNTKFQQEFEILANKILEEKSTRFTLQNKENLDQILKPFQEKIAELKNTVNKTYDVESKERFSLGEKVKELAELNQKIADDAKKLTKALSSNSKTQGNWGEMILESILEKSGLTKGREYFMEYQLKDQNNQALYSEFSGKKMRPDAVVKYPDQRNVIIDSKVSLTAFLESVDEPDDDLRQLKLNQHVSSIQNHIRQLSQKGYDDYDKSLDFVMMFIPNEAAYIAAMQTDPNLWNFAYEKRILLLNPSNLITSLKLLADLWKKDYQNKNAMEIADKGAKLYDKFVGFISNLEEVGKSINKANTTYQNAYKQLYTGRNNLISQSEKLKNLGIKNKKEISQDLINQSSIDYK